MGCTALRLEPIVGRPAARRFFVRPLLGDDLRYTGIVSASQFSRPDVEGWMVGTVFVKFRDHCKLWLSIHRDEVQHLRDQLVVALDSTC